MRSVTDLFPGLNFTGDGRLVEWLLDEERRFLGPLLDASRRTVFQSTGEPTEICGIKAKGKGEKFSFNLAADSASKPEEMEANAPEICAPA